MTGDTTPEDHRILRLPDEEGALSAADLERAEQTIEALLRLRAQLLQTQAALDDYLARLGTTADEAPRTSGG